MAKISTKVVRQRNLRRVNSPISLRSNNQVTQYQPAVAPVNLSLLSSVERAALRERLRRRVVYLLSPQNLLNDRYYRERIEARTVPGKKPYLHFGEILRCHSINDFGVIDAPVYYDLLESAVREASRTILGLAVWRVPGHNRIYFN
jgi:hypothetical protein